MSFLTSKEINVQLYNLKQPIFDQTLNLFISQFLDNNDKLCEIKSSSLKFIDLKNNYIQIEFLPSSNDFYNLINNLDNYIKDLIINNGSKWFNSNLNIETINNIFKRSINLPLSIPSLPLMDLSIGNKLKITNKKKRTGNKKMTLNDLIKNMEIELCFNIIGIFFHKHKCHINFEVNEIHILNDVCQSLECLLNDSEENYVTDIQSESNDVNTISNIN